MKVKKIVLIATVAALSLCGCKEKFVQTENIIINTVEDQIAKIDSINKKSSLKVKDEVEEDVGFSIKLPAEIPGWVEETTYRNRNDNTIEVLYSSMDDEIRIRKTKEKDNLDGMYKDYRITKELTHNEKVYTIKGEDETAHYAIWEDDGYHYAVSMNSGLPRGDFLLFIAQIK